MELKDKNYLLLQINDSTFPIGAYSHSYGLETYIQNGMVNNAEDAMEYIKNKIKYGFLYTELLAVKLAYEYTEELNMEGLDNLEEILRASRIPKEIQEAGDKLGSRFVKTVLSLPILLEDSLFNQFVINRNKEPIFYSIAYGVFCASVGIGLREAFENYLYSQTSALVTTCVKTIPLSQTDGQKILFKLSNSFVSVIDKVLGLTENDLCLTVPGFDIRSMQHETLYSRLYMS